jgi:hypothetical protein
MTDGLFRGRHDYKTLIVGLKTVQPAEWHRDILRALPMQKRSERQAEVDSQNPRTNAHDQKQTHPISDMQNSLPQCRNPHTRM